MQSDKTTKPHIGIRDITVCAMFTALIIAGAFIKIPVPFIPFTMQFLFTNLAALVLDRNRGAIAVLVYILLGLLGIPIFTSGGGLGYIFQPTFGYLIGFLVGAFTAGKIVTHSPLKSTKTFLLAGAVNLLIVYAIGVLYFWLIKTFYLQSPVGVSVLLVQCFLIFIPSDGVSCIISAILAKRLYRKC